MIGLESLELDHDVFVLLYRQFFFAIYVNDLLFFVFDNFCLTDIQDKPNIRFKMINLGEICGYLGMEVDVEVGKKISLWQTTHLKKLLQRFQIADSKLTSVSMIIGLANFLLFPEKQTDWTKIKWY